MSSITQIKKHFVFIKYQKLIIAALIIGFLSAFLAISLKRGTEHYEELLFNQASKNNLFLFIFPLIGLTIIAVLRYYLFNKKTNKGIKEIFETTEKRKNSLPIYKIPSHFINGLFTVIFGGSTGIEVSTVVASATIGSMTQEKENILNRHKVELICAGVASGITALFFSPFAGFLFAYEVISKKASKTFILVTTISVSISILICLLLNEKPLFHVTIKEWHWKAFPYFILLGVISGMNAVYLTKTVLFIKDKFTSFKKSRTKIIISAVLISIGLFILPQLYGDGYHAIKENLANSNNIVLTIPIFFSIVSIVIFKPIITSLTLAGGGDGGVFAPSIFIGGFVGLLLAVVLNTFFNTNVIPLNFMIIGMGAMLSASIHAPFTAIFITCGLINDYSLLFPILVTCLVAKQVSKTIYPFTVYSFSNNKI